LPSKFAKFSAITLLLASNLVVADVRPVLVTSIHPLTLIASDLAGDWLEVKQLLADNQEPHHVSLSISQRELLEDPGLVLWVGPFMESFLVKAMAGVPEQHQLSMQEIVSSEKSSFEDAHYWLDPFKVRLFYAALADRLQAQFPDYGQQIDVSLENALGRLDSAIVDAQVALAPYSGSKVIVDHQAYGHLAGFAGIEVLGALTDERGASLGARGFGKLMNQTEVACILVEQLPPVKGAIKLAQHYDRPLVEIDPLGRHVSVEQGYIGLLGAVVDGLKDCFSVN
jgi:zinc transport system substrate-binding protein